MKIDELLAVEKLSPMRDKNESTYRGDSTLSNNKCTSASTLHQQVLFSDISEHETRTPHGQPGHSDEFKQVQQVLG